MRYQVLRKKLLTEGAIAVTLLVGLGGGCYFIDSMHDGAISRKQALEAQLSTVTNEENGLREKYIRIQKDNTLYQKIMAMDANDQLSLDSRAFSNAIADFRKRYNLVLGYSATDPVTVEDAKYKRPTSVIESRDVALTFKAVDDEDVYEMIQALQKELPGTVKINTLKLTKASKLTDQSLREITRNGQYGMIEGKMDITWYGIAPADPVAAKAAKKAKSSRRR